MNNRLVSPSILAADLTDLASVLKKLDPSVTDYLHIDVMDGHFVPPITFGEQYCEAITKHSKIPLDVHLMVSQPQLEVPKYFSLKPKFITFHLETTAFPLRIADSIRKQGIQSGLSLNPLTPIANLKDIIWGFDLILLMTIEPGYYGQKFMPNGMPRLKELNELRNFSREKYKHDFVIEIDGGVNDKNAAELYQNGADILVSGSYLFGSSDINQKIIALKNAQ